MYCKLLYKKTFIYKERLLYLKKTFYIKKDFLYTADFSVAVSPLAGSRSKWRSGSLSERLSNVALYWCWRLLNNPSLKDCQMLHYIGVGGC